MYTKILRLDLGSVEPALAGPKRPQDRVPLTQVKSSFANSLTAPVAQRGFGLTSEQLPAVGKVVDNGHSQYWSRCCRYCSDHELHQHIEPIGHARAGLLPSGPLNVD